MEFATLRLALKSQNREGDRALVRMSATLSIAGT